jgi:predicted flap endonuclease-1-like 5' DNA nuclease
MSHLVLELLLWIVFAFFVGCVLGCVFRKLFGPEPEVVLATAAGKTASVRSVGAPAMTRGTVETAKPQTQTIAPKTIETAKPAPEPARRKAEAPKAATPASVRSRTVETAKPAAEPVARRKEEPATATEMVREPTVASGKPQQPKGLAAPRAGKPDDLTRVSGIGPKIERTLHGLGYFHFDQIAAWTPDEVQWVDEHLKFKGRIARDEWQNQARLLAGGNTPPSEAEVGKKPARRKASATQAKKTTSA